MHFLNNIICTAVITSFLYSLGQEYEDKMKEKGETPVMFRWSSFSYLIHFCSCPLIIRVYTSSTHWQTAFLSSAAVIWALFEEGHLQKKKKEPGIQSLKYVWLPLVLLLWISSIWFLIITHQKFIIAGLCVLSPYYESYWSPTTWKASHV